MIKCIGCYGLRRNELTVGGRPLVVYNCPGFFPYECALSGLLLPGSGIVEAVKDCPEQLGEHCILCAKPWVTSYGFPPNVFACKEHDQAWGKWLKDHPDRHAYISPIGRLRKANWVEVFREFIEDMREKQGS